MTELKRAREHLLYERAQLSDVRAFPLMYQSWHLRRAESAVLAALSWVWQCQEDEKDNRRDCA